MLICRNEEACGGLAAILQCSVAASWSRGESLEILAILRQVDNDKWQVVW